MPLSKQAKALYEAALRRKGLHPGKAVRQDPRTFVGPIEMYKCSQPYDVRFVEGKPRTQWRDEMVPRNTYWNHRGRFQDLEDELDAAIDAGIWERKNPMAHTYYRYYNDGDIPRGIVDPAYQQYRNSNYNDASSYRYHLSDWEPYLNLRTRDVEYRQRGLEPHLTRLGELELEARADEMIENDYKDYLRKMFEGKIPVQEGYSLEDVYDYMPYDERRNYYEHLPYYYRTSAWPERREYHKTKEGMEKGMGEARNIGYQILDYGRNPNAWTIQDIIEGKIK